MTTIVTLDERIRAEAISNERSRLNQLGNDFLRHLGFYAEPYHVARQQLDDLVDQAIDFRRSTIGEHAVTEFLRKVKHA